MKKKKTQQKKFVVGLTGGVATGKTTIAYLFKQFGAHVICCDQVAHKALRKKSPSYRAIVKQFGKGILDTHKKISRKKLASVIFNNKKKRKDLEAIIHPFVFQKIFESIKKAKGILIIDIPLLFETRFQKHVECIVVVSCTFGEQIKRLMIRDNLLRCDAVKRIKTQLPLAKKRKMADWVIDNSSVRNAIYETKKMWDTIQTITK
ncbi:MAG: dephospho-CoA kinase [Candidatus Omnitrophica bacterium]|nr:dephospho-CoA kinase [Candidatus Omnitrophota bacterium]